MNISSLIERCHKASVNGGWYTDLSTGEKLDRNIGEMMVLIHSEVSEAYDAWVNDEMDDKLPHRLGVEVEIADTLIRIFDLCGYQNLSLENSTIIPTFGNNIEKAFNLIHLHISNAYEGYRKSNITKLEENLTTVICIINNIAETKDYNLVEAVDEKLAFNATRADHKIENRKKSGGKRT